MKIHRAVKVAAKKNEIIEALGVAARCDIHGIEVQEIVSLMEEKDFKERGRIVLDGIGNYPVKYLVYHYPLKFPFRDFDDMLNIDIAGKKFKYILDLTEDTIREAGYVGSHLKLKKVFVVVHNIGFAPKNEISRENYGKRMALGEKSLRELAGMAKIYSDKYNCEISLVRENNPPDQEFADGLLDFDPRDLKGTVSNGVNINIDLAHLWMYALYRQNGKGEFPGVDLTREIYPEFDPVECIKQLAPSVRMLHLNDAGPGFTGKYEGIEIGTGDLPHKKIIEAVLENAASDIVGTYEIKYGHIDPETMYRSDIWYRKIFGEKFREYFD